MYKIDRISFHLAISIKKCALLFFTGLIMVSAGKAFCQGTGWQLAWPQSTPSTIQQPLNAVSGSASGSLGMSFVWEGPGSAPATSYWLEKAWSGFSFNYSGVATAASDGLGDPFVNGTSSDLGTGGKLVQMSAPTGSQPLIFTDLASGSWANAGAWTTDMWNAGFSVSKDTRGVSITRTGSTSADTVFSYYDQNGSAVSPNAQTFNSVLTGNWGTRSNYSWNPSSNGYFSTGPNAVTMTYLMPASSVMLTSSNQLSGTPTGPQTLTFVYTCTDSNDGATATANYVLKVHDIYEPIPGTDTTSNAIGSPIIPSGSQWVANTTSTTEQEQVSAGSSSSSSFGLMVSGSGGPWEVLGLGLGLNYSYTVTWTIGETASAMCPPDTETILTTGPNYLEHTGQQNGYNAAGFTGISTYTVMIPNGTYIAACNPVPFTQGGNGNGS